MSRVRRPPPAAKPNVLLSFFLLSVFPGRALAFVLASTFHVVIDRGPCAYTDADGRVFRLPLRTSVRGAGVGLFCKFTKRQIEVTFPKHSRFDGDHIFYSVLYIHPCSRRGVSAKVRRYKEYILENLPSRARASSIYPAY